MTSHSYKYVIVNLQIMQKYSRFLFLSPVVHIAVSLTTFVFCTNAYQ